MKVLYASLSEVSPKVAANKVAELNELPMGAKVKMKVVHKGMVTKNLEWRAHIIYDSASDLGNACLLMSAKILLKGWCAIYVSPEVDDFMKGDAYEGVSVN
jgi:hypothetical protein